MRAEVTLDAYEIAERELLLTHARRVLRRNAIALAIAAVLLVVGELVVGGAHWLAYLAVSLWALGVAVYYRGWVRHGDRRIREQQFRAEWQAGRANELLTPRT
jgi:4-hydroxybenzoate polyprenyltransferase